MVVTEYKLYIGVCGVKTTYIRVVSSLTQRILVLSQTSPSRRVTLVAEIQRFQRAAREESC